MQNYFIWWGQSFFEFYLDGTHFLIDPYLDNSTHSTFERLIPCPARISDFRGVDYIFVTHEHFDHFDKPAVEAISRSNNALVVAPAPVTSQLDLQKNLIKTVRAGDLFSIGNLEVTVTPAVHTSAHPVGYVIEADGISIYHAGDTKYFQQMKNIHADIAFLPIGGRYTMDIIDAVRAAKDIKPKYVVPMHYNTFREIRVNIDNFEDQMRVSAPNIHYLIPHIGERIEF